MLVAGAGEMAGSAGLVLVDGAVLLRPELAVFEAILAGWRLQQESRLLAAPTVDGRDKTLRRFQEFTGEYPWRWGPADIEEWSVSLRSAGRSRTTIRAYQNAAQGAELVASRSRRTHPRRAGPRNHGDDP